MKSARERMDIIAAYREVGTYRGAAAICGTTHKTVKRVNARHEAGGDVAPPRPRERNYDDVAGWSPNGSRRRTAGSRRSGCCRRRAPPGIRVRRGTSGGWSRTAEGVVAPENHRGRRPAVWSPGQYLVIDWGDRWARGVHVSARCWRGVGCGSCASRPTSARPRPCDCSDRGADPARAAHRGSAEVDVEPVLAEQTARRGRRLGLAAVLDPGLLQLVVELSGAVGVVAVDAARSAPSALAYRPRLGRARRSCVWRPVHLEQVGDEVFGDAGVPGVARGDRGGGDDLASPGPPRRGPCSRRTRARRSCARAGPPGPRWRSPDPQRPGGRSGTPRLGPVSRSWPSTVASSFAGLRHRLANSRPSSSASSANPSRARESINSSRAARSSQSICGLPAPA